MSQVTLYLSSCIPHRTCSNPGESILGLSAKQCQNIASGTPDPCKDQRTKWHWCWAGILWTQSLFAGLEAEATSMGCSMGHSEEIQSKILHWDCVDTEELSGLLFGRCGYLSKKEKVAVMAFIPAWLSGVGDGRFGRFPFVSAAFPIAPAQIQASQFSLWKLASAYFCLCVKDDRSKFSLCPWKTTGAFFSFSQLLQRHISVQRMSRDGLSSILDSS